MTERARRRRRRALARAPARVRTGARRVCFAHLVMRSPRTRVAPALTRALPPSRNRVFTGRHLRLYRQDRDRAHRARQAPHPDPGCQPQGAPPPNFERSAEPKNRACLRFRTDCALAIARSRARRAARSEMHARRARRTRPAFSCPHLSVALARAPPPASATAGAATRRFGCAPREKTAETPFPSRPRASGVFARATWRSRGRYLVIFRVSEPVSKKVFSRVFGKKFFH